MPNNIYDDIVSEKAVWEGSITPDETTSRTPHIRTQMQTQTDVQTPFQPQMMFCYKCNQVIPSNSTYCPYCQIKLFTECPKCGAKYSSQYPACNQCGTNREEYLEWQREREERAERGRIFREEFERKQQQKRERIEQEKEQAYYAENEEIIKTEEYKSAYALFVDAFKTRNRRIIISKWLQHIAIIILPFAGVAFMCSIEWFNNLDAIAIIAILVGLFIIIYLIGYLLYIRIEYLEHKFFFIYISKRNNYDKEIITPKFIEFVAGKVNKKEIGFSDYFPDYYIISYRKKNKMPIYKKWHSYSY